MSPHDHETERLIRQALEQDDAEVPRELDDPSPGDLLVEMFRGKHRRLAWAGAAVNLALVAAAILSAVRFLGSEDLRAMLLWGGAALLCMGLVAAIKVWYWLEMVRLALTRDVKRLELRLVELRRELFRREP